MQVRLEKARRGISGDLEEWLTFNRAEAFASPEALALVAPFPPQELMQNTSGLLDPKDFASHGCDILSALSAASPQPVASFRSVLDFGVGVGRLARMFKGFEGSYTGVDVDARHVAWVSSALDHVTAFATTPRAPLPLPDKAYDCIVSISVFTHMNEQDQFFYLSELARVARPGAVLMLTVHGERALKRAETEEMIFRMLSVPRAGIAETRALFPRPGFKFIRQNGHLTTDQYEYGITFISRDYVEKEWGRYFDVVDATASIHDFQDVMVLRAR